MSTKIGYCENYPLKKVLVLVENHYDNKASFGSKATAMGREMVQLLGHFNTDITIYGVADYKEHDIDKYNVIIYVGYSGGYKVPDVFGNDVINTSKEVIWINAGLENLSKTKDFNSRFGFIITDSVKRSKFDAVKSSDFTFDKGTSDINLVKILNKKVEIWATAINKKSKAETPYIIKSGNFIYVADLPFLGADEKDRYLLFADKLHEMLNELHPVSHHAIIRIEDVTALNNPDRLREIADILAEYKIPFLVGVVPIYVNPIEDRRVRLTDKPELVDALKYMVQNGGNIVMHGVTHQYRGVSTEDFEFWDDNAKRPIHDENEEDISRRIESGLDEFLKNGLYPIAWETPHYTASNMTYKVVAKYFSTAVEQRLAIENFDYGQYFPYIINKDIYGQTIYPEELGYVPLNPNLDSSMVSVDKIINGSKYVHHMRDGIASCFYHPFLNPKLLRHLIDGLKAQGYDFLDLSEYNNIVKVHDKVIITGDEKYSIKLDNSFLHEIYFDQDGNITRKLFSPERINGIVTNEPKLKPGEMYLAEGIDYQTKEPSLKDKIVHEIDEKYIDFVGEKNWELPRIKICWNQYAKGAAYYDQCSFVNIFKSLNIPVDTIFSGQILDLKDINLLIVPYSSVDSLPYFDYDKIARYLKNGGNLITDRRNKLIEKLGVRFYNNESRIEIVRDELYPNEFINWKYGQLVNKFDHAENDVIFCDDVNSGLTAAMGRPYGKGKILFFNTWFDQHTPNGYSTFPYALEYVKKYFQIQPVFRRENLDFYFDPGYRQNISVENLIKTWVKSGIRVVHIAGWHEYQKYNYDYARVIHLAHANGILVYAWIEPPQVNQKFWEKHPEWREKNYLNEDVRPSWRYPVAMTDKKCLTAMVSEYLSILKAYDWDGVNIGEMYFESGKGFDDPKLFTPMHPSARKEFKNMYGFDPIQVFDQNSDYYWKKNNLAKEELVKYRVDKISSVSDKLLQAIYKFKRDKPGFNVMVTFMDTHFSPEIEEYDGGSSDKIIELQKKYGFLLQAEDPESKWSTDPSRYIEFGKYYKSQIADSSKLLIDLNILNFRKREDVTPFPTLRQTGIESYQLINCASIGAPRFTIYSEESVNPQDMFFFPYASSSDVKYRVTENGYVVNSPYAFTLKLPANIKIINVDGQPVEGYRDNTFLITAGNHKIILNSNGFPGFSTVTLQPQVLSFSGNILSINYDMRRVSFKYISTEKALVALNSKPTTILVDGKSIKFDVLSGNDCFTVFLPVGQHKVVIETGDKFSYGLNITSLWSISAIAIYGLVAVLALFIMFVMLKIFRRRLEK